MHKSRRPLLAANWKMNHLRADASAYARTLAQRVDRGSAGAAAENLPELCVCPPSLYIAALRDALRIETGGRDIAVGAQDVSEHAPGAHTGELAAAMLKDEGCAYCIAGHSERRASGESDAQVGGKLARLREASLAPILCVGEGLATREAGEAVPFTLAQLDAVRAELALLQAGAYVVAYEPIWAIGTGRNAEPADAQEMCAAIRAWLVEALGAAHAAQTRILYGGSVKPANIEQYLRQPDVDGALIGGASLAADDFAEMAETCATALREM